MDTSSLLAFAVGFFAFAASPGPSNVTVVTCTISQGAASGVAYGVGTVAGILVFLTVAILGLSVMQAQMETIMILLRYVGGAYLVWLGIKLCEAEPVVPQVNSMMRQRGLLRTLATGLVMNLGNPKMPMLYVVLLPSLVGGSLTLSRIAVLISIVLGVEVLVIGAHVVLAGRARRLLRTPASVRRVNQAAGIVMVGAGVLTIAAG